MALSSSESELLTQTCENMNVAANTCREVLEMLRNLGNTGVVDIADHNNAQGRHSNDKTLFHVTVGSNYQRYSFKSANGNYPYTNVDYWDNGNYSESFQQNSNGNTSGGSGSYVINRLIYTTDSNRNDVSFENYNVSSLLALGFDATRLHDRVNEKEVACGIRYYANRDSVFNDGNGISPYSTIGFMVTPGAYGSINTILAITYPSLHPLNNNTISLGWSGRAFKDLFVVNSPTVTSDRRAKKDVASIGSQAVDFIKALRPISYKLKQGEGHIDPVDENGNPIPVENSPVDREGIRTHWGLIAQEVKEALSTAGYEDAALWCLADKNDPDSQQSLRYEELIAPLIKVVQQQQERIEALERKVA